MSLRGAWTGFNGLYLGQKGKELVGWWNNIYIIYNKKAYQYYYLRWLKFPVIYYDYVNRSDTMTQGRI